MKTLERPIRILLIEDSPSDAQLTIEALKEGKVGCDLSLVEDGVQAMQFLRHEGEYENAARPDIILLDLNIPRKDGRQVLAELKSDPKLRTIPVVVLTTSGAEDDILQAYHNQANCYITKPVSFTQFLQVIRSIESFWLAVATLPSAP